MMGTLELKNKLVEIINSSDDKFLHMVNTLHKSYLNKKAEEDLFDKLPSEIQELLMESRLQSSKGNTRSHNEVMSDFRQKYTISTGAK